MRSILSAPSRSWHTCIDDLVKISCDFRHLEEGVDGDSVVLGEQVTGDRSYFSLPPLGEMDY